MTLVSYYRQKYWPDHRITQEILPSCRQLIVDHIPWYNNTTEAWHPPPCVHGDLTEVMAPPVNCSPNDSFMRKLYAMNKAPMKTKQWCYTHCQECSLGIGGGMKPDYDISGLPCPDMSPAGSQQREEGPTAPVFICHAKLHIALQTPMLVIENVPDWFGVKTTTNINMEFESNHRVHFCVC